MLDDNLNGVSVCGRTRVSQQRVVLKAQLSIMLAEGISVRINVLNNGTNLSSSPCCSDLKSLGQPSLTALSLCVCVSHNSLLCFAVFCVLP